MPKADRVELKSRFDVAAGPEDLVQTLLAPESWQDAPEVVTAPTEKVVISDSEDSGSEGDEEPTVAAEYQVAVTEDSSYDNLWFVHALLGTLHTRRSLDRRNFICGRVLHAGHFALQDEADCSAFRRCEVCFFEPVPVA